MLSRLWMGEHFSCSKKNTRKATSKNFDCIKQDRGLEIAANNYGGEPMPSQKTLSVKQQYVADLAEKLKGAAAGVVVDYKGINVADDTALRKSLREAGVSYTVVKNTMLKLALKEAGIDGLDGVLEGTTALAIHEEDPIVAAKILGEFADKNKKFTLKAGFMDGKVLSDAEVVALGKLPSKEQLVGQLVSVLVAPMRGLAIAVNAIAEKESA